MKKIILLIILLLTMVGCSFKDEAILDGYYDSNEYFSKTAFQDWTDYCKYYYEEKYDKDFINNKLYSRVANDDVENIAGYFNDLKKWMVIENRQHEFDFENDIISPGDYVYIKTKEGQRKMENKKYQKYDVYSVYLYDIDTHTLYYIENNN